MVTRLQAELLEFLAGEGDRFRPVLDSQVICLDKEASPLTILIAERIKVRFPSHPNHWT